MKIQLKRLFTSFIRWIYKTVRPSNQIHIYEFYKENEKWYINVPHYPGPKSALQMVCGADKLLDRISEGALNITLDLSLEYDESRDTLWFDTECPGGGAWYRYMPGTPGEDRNVWLCDVTLYLFGHFPKRICFKVI